MIPDRWEWVRVMFATKKKKDERTEGGKEGREGGRGERRRDGEEEGRKGRRRN